jgi:hypothetical protein
MVIPLVRPYFRKEYYYTWLYHDMAHKLVGVGMLSFLRCITPYRLVI